MSMHRPSGCPSCAEPLEEGDRFCGVCGYALSSPPPPPDRTPTVPDPSGGGAAGPAYAARVPAPAEAAGPDPARVPAPAEAAGPDPTPGYGSPAQPARVPAPTGGPGYGVPAGGYSGAPARQEDHGFAPSAGVPAPGWEGTPAAPGPAPTPAATPDGETPYGSPETTRPGAPYAAAPQETPYGGPRHPDPQTDPYPPARTAGYGTPAARYDGTPQGTPHEAPYGSTPQPGPYEAAHEDPPGAPHTAPHEDPYGSTPQGTPQPGPSGTRPGHPNEAPSATPQGTPQGTPHQDPYGSTPQGTPHQDPYGSTPQGNPQPGPYEAAHEDPPGAQPESPHGSPAATPQGTPHQDPSATPQGSGGGGRTCVACRAGYVDTDGYCEHCGHAQPRERDHQEEELCSVAAVSDRGLRHHRNEDSFSVAATALPDGSAATVAIVCDGVSSASRPDDASAAAAGAASEVLLDALPRGAQPAEAMHEAILAAGAAVSALAPQPPGAQNAPACTLVGAVVSGGQLTIGWVGDSRAYWVPDDRAVLPRRLTEDDSWAAQMVAAGLMGETEAYSDVRAHAITGWLGADAYDLDPHTASFRPDHPGVVVVCTDGLWNYAESAADMARILPADAAERPLHCAQVLVGHALDGGGHDNITVAVVPFAAAPPQEEAEPEAEAEAAAGPAAERPHPAA
ncbi:protein phosphatase 2C domain-containing protein [Streptomyces sp. NPDC059708]|uniref:protein phosphatase 2C domain-containing protein n=1 Tax=Streptomyces sp. NPDC059708 TaxID=3346916 RepID=UPI003681EF3D